MHIVVDGGTWANKRGYGRFTREILTAASGKSLRHAFSIVVEPSVAREDVPSAIRVVHAPLDAAPSTAAGAASRRSLGDLRRMSRALAREDADCFFFPSVYTYVPVVTRAPIVVCIHDVIPERFPDHVFASRRARLFWTLKVRAAVAQATRVVTVSDHAREGLVELLGVPGDRIRVVREAPAAAFSIDADLAGARAALQREGVAGDSPFVLYVGGIAPHKNLEHLVETIVDIRRKPAFGPLRLLIVGDYAEDVFLSSYPKVRALVERDAADAVRFLGALPDATVAGLMRLCRALALPSLDEGFGLPGIEAAACGAAVVATIESGLPEVLGDAAVYFDPGDRTALKTALEQVLADDQLRAELGRRAAARARACTWNAAADRLLAVFDELAG